MPDNEEEQIPGLSALGSFKIVKDEPPPEWSTRKCGSCKFFIRMSDVDRIARTGMGGPIIGNCRQSPPGVVFAGVANTPRGPQPQFSMMYPSVPEEWESCGQFQVRA